MSQKQTQLNSSSNFSISLLDTYQSKYSSLKIKSLSDIEYLSKILIDLLKILFPLRLDLQESWCLDALKLLKEDNYLSNYEIEKKKLRRNEKKKEFTPNYDHFFYKFSSNYNINQLKNHAIRFSLADIHFNNNDNNNNNNNKSSSSWSFFNNFLGNSSSSSTSSISISNQSTSISSISSISSSSSNINLPSFDYEDVLISDILHAPIIDICLVSSNETPPPGFYRISKTPNNYKANLNTNSGGNSLYLCIKKDLTGNLPVVSSIIIIFPDRGEILPHGYEVVKRNNLNTNLNLGNNGEKIYMAYKKDILGNPITDIQIIFPSKDEKIPRCFNCLEKTYSGILADMNTGTNGLEVYLCFKQELTRFYCLLNEGDSNSKRKDKEKEQEQEKDDDNENNSSENSSSLPSPSPSISSPNPISRDGSDLRTEDESFQDLSSKIEDEKLNRLSISSVDATCHTQYSEISSPLPSSDPLSPMPNSLQNSVTTSTPCISSPASRCSSPIPSETPILEPNTPQRSRNGSDSAFNEEVESEPYVSEVSPVEDSNEYEDNQSSENKSEIEANDSTPSLNTRVKSSTTSVAYNFANELKLKEQRKFQEVVDSEGNLISSIHRRCFMAILSSLYITHSDSSTFILLSLVKLMKETSFFSSSFNKMPVNDSINMIDLLIEALYDTIDSYNSKENIEISCELIFLILNYSNNNLSFYSIEKLLKILNFLNKNNSINKNSSFLTQILTSFSQEMSERFSSYKLSKILIWNIVKQVEKIDKIQNILPEDLILEKEVKEKDMSKSNEDNNIIENSDQSSGNKKIKEEEMKELVLDVVNDIINNFELSRYCESVVQLLSSQSISSSSYEFWNLLKVFSNKFFSQFYLRNAFSLLCLLCNEAWKPIKYFPVTANSNSSRSANFKNLTITISNVKYELSSYDLGTKLTSLEYLIEFLNNSGEKLKSSKIFGYCLRRILIPCIIYNLNYSLITYKILYKILKLLISLWKNFRSYIKLEFYIIFHQFLLKILNASLLEIKIENQMIIIQEIQNFLEQPDLLLEMFINYDLNSYSNNIKWNTFINIIKILCNLSRKINLITNNLNSSLNSSNSSVSNQNNSTASSTGVLFITSSEDIESLTVKDVYFRALEVISRISKTIMDVSGHACLMVQDSSFRKKSLEESTGWMEDDDEEDIKEEELNEESPVVPEKESEEIETPQVDPLSPGLTTSSTTCNSPSKPRKSLKVNSIRAKRIHNEENEEILSKALDMFHKEKKSLKHVIKFLVNQSFLINSPQEIANFLRLYKNYFDEISIGEYIGEGGVTSEEEVFYTQLRLRYIKAISFFNQDLLVSLRNFLTSCGFYMPGEAQKINRFVEVFVKLYWQDNYNTSMINYFKTSDAIHLVVYAIIMLNTDLHRTSDKKHKKMTKSEFLNNLRGVNNGEDIDRDYLSNIYDDILNFPIKVILKNDPVSSSNSGFGFFNFFSDKNNNSNVNKTNVEINHNLKKNIQSNDILSLFLLTLNQNNTTNNTSNNFYDNKLNEEKKFMIKMYNKLYENENLLRSLSYYSYNFNILNINMKISQNLITYLFESVWYQFHAVIETILTSSSSNLQSKLICCDILGNSLAAAIFLNLEKIKKSFLSFLKYYCELTQTLPHVVNDECQHRILWEDDLFSPSLNKMEVIANLHKLLFNLKDTLMESSNYEITRQIANSFEKKSKILDQNSFFVRQGELSKLNRLNKITQYSFFLFSDYFLYAHLNNKKEFVVHEQLSLSELTIQDVETDPTSCSFFISHPSKSFVVIAESPQIKQQWINDISITANSCKKRESLITPA